MASPRVFVGEGSVVSTLGALGTLARTRSYRVQVRFRLARTQVISAPPGSHRAGGNLSHFSSSYPWDFGENLIC